ncbi:MAG: hypothetical protein JRN20_21965 [Nitrososphaerota archaeon]|nr:hypothetical protein [Nitrososphaerota archaeon]
MKIGSTTTLVLIAFLVISSLAMVTLLSPGMANAAKAPPLNSMMCTSLGGTWNLKTSTCTIPAVASGVASSSFAIPPKFTLDIIGSLTINTGVTIANSGTIIVENAGGVNQSQEFDDWETGILVLGTLANSGTITVENRNATTLPKGIVGTVGISVWVSATNMSDRSTFLFGTLTNTGAINIQNLNQTRGIENIGTITNSPSGTITVANSGNGSSSVGIYNRVSYGPVLGTLTNEGSITIKNSGNNSFGIYSHGILVNSGVLIVNSLSGAYPGPNASLLFITGIYNSGAFTQTASGTYYNYDGYVNLADPTNSAWGNFNNHGTMVNYGKLFTNGTFFTNGYTMINIGTINDTSTALLYDTGLQTGSSMINYGTIYNYGTIERGEEYGICYDLVNGTGC